MFETGVDGVVALDEELFGEHFTVLFEGKDFGLAVEVVLAGDGVAACRNPESLILGPLKFGPAHGPAWDLMEART